MAYYRQLVLLLVGFVALFFIKSSAVYSDGCLGNVTGWRQRGSRCIWVTARGIQEPEDDSCSRQNSTLLSFHTLGEALDVLGILNISASTPVFIGYLNTTDVNGSLKCDWFGGPGDWSPIHKDNTSTTNSSTACDGNQTLCLHILNRQVNKVDCVSVTSVSVCESDTDHCVCLNRSADHDRIPSVHDVPHNTKAPTPIPLTTEPSTSDTFSNNKAAINTTASPTSVQNSGNILSSHPTASSVLETTPNILDAELSTRNTFSSQKTLTTSSAPIANMPTVRWSTTRLTTLTDKPSASNQIKPTNIIPTAGLESIANKSNSVDLSETIKVPGPNGTMVEKNMSNIFQHVFSHSNKSQINQAVTSTASSTSQYQPGIRTSEVPPTAGLNGTGNQNGDGHNQTIDMANVTRVSTHPECVFPGNKHTKHTPTDRPCIDTETTEAPTPTGPPVKEVEFKVQISGLNGDPVLLIDSHVAEHGILQNMSRELKALREETKVDNCSLTKFADIVQNVADNAHISGEPQDVKRDLFADIMRVAEDMVVNVADPAEDLYVSTDTIDQTLPSPTQPSLLSKLSWSKMPDFLSDIFPIASTVTEHFYKNSNMKKISSRIVQPTPNSSHVQLVCEDSGNLDIQITSAIYLRAIMERYLETVRISTILYRNMDDVVQASNDNIGSDVMAVSVQYITNDTFMTAEKVDVSTENAIIFVMRTFLKRNKKEDKRLCTHWDFKLNQWSSSGCQVVAKNASHTTCKCDHLTNFAILVMYTDIKISLPNQHVLFALTTVGCSLSIACLAMTLITYIYLNMLSNEKVMIHANLSLALMLAQIVFVSSGDAHENAVACKAVAVLLHFLFMASFTWMLVEGVALYLCCARGIFNHRDMRMKYFLLGWGLPTLIVVISFAAKFPEYGNGPQYSCWLSIHDGVIWAFLGPMVVIVLLNICVMALVLKVFLTLRANTQKTEVARFRGSVRAMLTLLPLLGVTWILSLFVPLSVVFHYFFVILNTIQGMCIFFLHCVCNEEIRKKFYEKRRKWSTTRTASDAEMSYPARKKTGSFDAIKAAAAATTASSEYARRSAWT